MMMIRFQASFLAALSMCSAVTTATIFQQVGSLLLGPSVDSSFGQGVSLSQDGAFLAVGAPTDDATTNDDAGSVTLYNFDGTNYVISNTIVGSAGEQIGDRMSLSALGGNEAHVAIRHLRTASPDVVAVYNVTSNTQIGSDLSCAFNGIEVSLAATGTRVAVSCETFGGIGRVEVFDLIGETWTSIGTIDGDQSGSLFGWSTALNDVGDRIAIGAPNQDTNGLDQNGIVRVFQHDGTSWDQVGADLEGGEDGAQFGFSLDMSNDGTTLVIGSPQSSGGGTNLGQVEGYDLVGGTTWSLMGTPITGEDTDDRFGRSVSIDGNGSRIAASSYLHNEQRGQVRVFDFDGSGWNFAGEIEGRAPGDQAGIGVKGIALNIDGDRLVFGSPGDDSNGVDSGSASVFDLIATASPTVPTTPSPTPTPGTFAPIGSQSSGTVFPTVTLGKFDWDLKRHGNASVAFSNNANTEEIVLEYNISLREHEVQLFEEDCLTTVPSSVVIVSSNTTIMSPTHGNLAVTLDIQQEQVVSSGIWTNTGVGFGLVSVCVRVDLLLDDANKTSIHFHEQRVFVTIDLTQDFHVENIDLERLGPDDEIENAQIEYFIDACHCNATYDCVNDIIVQGSDLYICITTNETELVLSGVLNLDLSQDSRTYRIVDNGIDNPLTETTSGLDGGQMLVVRTQTFAELFALNNPSNLTAWGEVVVAFARRIRRRLGEPLLLNRVHSLPESTGQNHRRTEDNSDTAGFNVQLRLAPATGGPLPISTQEGQPESSSPKVVTAISVVLCAFALIGGEGGWF